MKMNVNCFAQPPMATLHEHINDWNRCIYIFTYMYVYMYMYVN